MRDYVDRSKCTGRLHALELLREEADRNRGRGGQWVHCRWIVDPVVPEQNQGVNRAVNAPIVQAENAPPIQAEVPPENPVPVPEPPVPVPDDFENADWGEPVVAIEPVAPVGR